MSADKIGAQHRARKAVLYVRQSSAHQVQHNRESGALQYAMRERLVQLGWSEIEVVDDDLGRSAAGGVARAGFERMVAEVCLGRVGAVACRGPGAASPPPSRPRRRAPARPLPAVPVAERGGEPGMEQPAGCNTAGCDGADDPPAGHPRRRRRTRARRWRR